MLFPYSLRLSAAIAAVIAPVSAQAAEIRAQDEIEEIVVIGRYTVSETIDTATGLGLSIAETPQSVSILTELRIRDQALNTIVEAVDHTVGVSSSAVDNVRNTLAARGFEISNYQIDSVPLSWSLAGDSGETIADLSIYERVEFVRGSTGLLTGVGDPSASINLVRKKLAVLNYPVMWQPGGEVGTPLCCPPMLPTVLTSRVACADGWSPKFRTEMVTPIFIPTRSAFSMA